LYKTDPVRQILKVSPKSESRFLCPRKAIEMGKTSSIEYIVLKK